MAETGDLNFERFRKERRQRRAQFGGTAATAPRPTGAREAERCEAKQVHETRLTQDVHDFLAAATKQAATIVERVTQVAEAETAERLSTEMHEFLEETMRRAASFLRMVQATRGNEAVKELEPMVSNLVGSPLDGFRHEGTAQLADKHIGQDPFSEEMPEPRATEAEVPADGAKGTSDRAAVADANATANKAGQSELEAKEADLDADHPLLGHVCRDPETLKRALKALVRAKVVSQDQARAIYRAELTVS